MADSMYDPTAVRRRFSSLRSGFAFFDAPGGAQVPDEVGEAIARSLREASANVEADYETSKRVEAIRDEAEGKAAALLGCEPQEIIFGANMSSLNFMLTRTAARDFQEGDEILVSSADHEGGVAPWLALAEDKGLRVQHIELLPDTRLDFDDLQSKLTDRTKVVACAYASNAVGTVVDVARVAQLAHSVGALAWIDAVHYAAHEPIDVRAVDVDILICSAYKFCGPHLGIAYGRESVLDGFRAYKARPTKMHPVGRRFETGTLPYEMLAGFNATIDYLHDIGGWEAIVPYERELGERFVATLPECVTTYGLPTMEGRVPTFLLNVEGMAAEEVALPSLSAGSACGPTTAGTR